MKSMIYAEYGALMNIFNYVVVKAPEDLRLSRNLKIDKPPLEDLAIASLYPTALDLVAGCNKQAHIARLKELYTLGKQCGHGSQV